MDKVYISILIVELLGLILGILEIVFDFNFNIFNNRDLMNSNLHTNNFLLKQTNVY